jgi:hypothetical protein
VVEEAKIRILIDRERADKQLSAVERRRLSGKQGVKKIEIRRFAERNRLGAGAQARGDIRDRKTSDARVGDVFGVSPSNFGTAALASRLKAVKISGLSKAVIGTAGAILGGIEATRTIIPMIEGIVFEVLSTGMATEQKEQFREEFRNIASEAIVDNIQEARANLTAGLKASPQALSIVTDLATAGIKVPIQDQKDILQAQFLQNLADDRAELEFAESRKIQMTRVLAKEVVDVIGQGGQVTSRLIDTLRQRLLEGAKTQ